MQPSRLISSSATPTISESGRPILLVHSSNDADYDHVAVWRDFIAKCQETKAFPLVLGTAIASVEEEANASMPLCPVLGCSLFNDHSGDHGKSITTAAFRCSVILCTKLEPHTDAHIYALDQDPK